MDFSQLYGIALTQEQASLRLENLCNTFFKGEGFYPDAVFSSSGRAEILGNHTDHNHGKVIVSAITCDILAAVKKTDNGKIKICSEGFNPIEIAVGDSQIREQEKGTSAALTRGVVHAIEQRGYTLGGFTAYLTSNIFKGAGVSSSAAYEVLIAEIINDLYLNNYLKPVDKAIIAQFSENVYFGKPCGLLDQSGIAIGSLTSLDFKDPNNPQIQKLGQLNGYSLIITNTGGDHASLTPHYALIRKEMEEVANFFGKSVLREVKYEELWQKIPEISQKLGERAVLRAMHFFEENQRVTDAAQALDNGDISTFLSAVDKSGLSSLCKLQNCCVPGDNIQPVILGLETSRKIIKDGAVRIHGGGFAGSILAICNQEQANSYIFEMGKIFGEHNVFLAQVRQSGTCRIK